MRITSLLFIPDRQQNTPKQIYTYLRQRILSVELRPGEPVNERQLTQLLGVSRTPIREALKRLAEDGLVAIVPSVGTSVALINVDRVKESCAIRLALEAITVRSAAMRMDAKAGRELRALIDQQIATLHGPDHVRNIAADNMFHRRIVEQSGVTMTQTILQQVMGEITRVRHLSIRARRRLEEPIVEHSAILSALSARDPDASERAMKWHLEESFKRILKIFDKRAEYLDKSSR